MKKVLIFISVFLLADVDPFNTPNNPKYLTHTEKMIYYNRKSINKLKKRISRLEFLQAKKFSEYDLQFEKLINKASSFTTLVDNLMELDEIYQGVETTYTYIKPTVDAATKTTTINSTTQVSISDERLKAITDKVIQMRIDIIS
jgi:hypothetical protein